MITQTVIFGIFRWFHLVSIIALVGAMIGLRYVAWPTIADQPEEVQRRLLSRMRRPLAGLAWSATLAAIISGTVNLVRALTVPPAPISTWHMIFGIKVLLAFGLFAIALGLSWPSREANMFQRRRRVWLSMGGHLGLLLVALSVALRFLSGK